MGQQLTSKSLHTLAHPQGVQRLCSCAKAQHTPTPLGVWGCAVQPSRLHTLDCLGCAAYPEDGK